MNLSEKKVNAKNLINIALRSALTIYQCIHQMLSKINVNNRTKPYAAGVLGVAILLVIFYFNSGSEVYSLNIKGQGIGYIENKQVLAEAINEVSDELSKSSGGVEITISKGALICKSTNLDQEDVRFMTVKEIKLKLLAAKALKAEAWAINVNGRNVTAATSEKLAKQVLDGVKNSYKSDNSIQVSASFKENVSITKASINVDQIMNPKEAIKLIVTGSKEPKEYIVKDGDTIWDIAAANGMDTSELEKANPNLNPNSIQIGQRLNLFEVKPYVTVMTKEVIIRAEQIDFKTIYEETNSLYKGETKIKTAGIYGTQEIKTEVVKENNIIVSTTDLESKVISEPQSQVALEGTKPIPAYVGSGVLSQPLTRIAVSSAFGSRGGGRHTGVDLRSPKGTPILAAGDGVVTFVGYSGTYGNLVKVKHGNGMETWYAHCDTTNVSVGDKVSKGQQIATVGMTGRTTGYHLHFMVLIDGVKKNPLNYI